MYKNCPDFYTRQCNIHGYVVHYINVHKAFEVLNILKCQSITLFIILNYKLIIIIAKCQVNRNYHHIK